MPGTLLGTGDTKKKNKKPYPPGAHYKLDMYVANFNAYDQYNVRVIFKAMRDC